MDRDSGNHPGMRIPTPAATAERLVELLHSRETPSLGGYGLQIVDRMADAWGSADGDCAQIWFELAR